MEWEDFSGPVRFLFDCASFDQRLGFGNNQAMTTGEASVG